jgi:hypothetical protein
VLRAERVEKITALVRWCACVGVLVAYHVIAMRSLRKGLISEADTCMHIPINWSSSFTERLKSNWRFSRLRAEPSLRKNLELRIALGKRHNFRACQVQLGCGVDGAIGEWHHR